MVVQVACGAFHTLALTGHGEAWACGGNGYGQLGIGPSADCRGPTPVRLSQGLEGRIASVRAGRRHSAILTTSGEILLSGDNSQGQLGCEGASGRAVFERCEALKEVAVRSVFCGADFSVVLDHEGIARGWGYNDDGELGIPDTEIVHAPAILMEGLEVRAVALGWFDSVFGLAP
ncbi:regulator of chromosome condensation 1/beta-lactamase-inhibitor protein II [Baffinella frigidus]|nr:regulator of chromosome condensation 1/beta-lactamase-inhibitor protein II [Cryptophyta sp. CCMP2293]